MKLLQVDTVGTEKRAGASMGAPRSPKGGEERTGEKGRGRRRAARQRGTPWEGPREKGVACECPSRANGAEGVHQRGEGGAHRSREMAGGEGAKPGEERAQHPGEAGRDNREM